MKNEKVSYLRCSLVSCDNPLVKQQRKFCSDECRRKCTTYKNQEIYKKVHDTNDSPRQIKSQSSIKHDEVLFLGAGEHVMDDYPVDNEILQIAITNHENNLIARADYEQQVIFDGFAQLQQSYNETHEESYASMVYRKNPEKHKEYRAAYYIGNKERVTQRGASWVERNKEHLRQYRKDYYVKRKKLMALNEDKPTPDTSTED